MSRKKNGGKRVPRVYTRKSGGVSLFSRHPFPSKPGVLSAHVPLPSSPPIGKPKVFKTPSSGVFVVQASRSQHAQRIDKALQAREPESYAEWLKHPNRYDVEGVDSKGPTPAVEDVVQVVKAGEEPPKAEPPGLAALKAKYDWDKNLELGVKGVDHWTNSGYSFHAPAEVVKVNDKSVKVKLLESTGSGVMSYPAGQTITCPRALHPKHSANNQFAPAGKPPEGKKPTKKLTDVPESGLSAKAPTIDPLLQEWDSHLEKGTKGRAHWQVEGKDNLIGIHVPAVLWKVNEDNVEAMTTEDVFPPQTVTHIPLGTVVEIPRAGKPDHKPGKYAFSPASMTGVGSGRSSWENAYLPGMMAATYSIDEPLDKSKVAPASAMGEPAPEKPAPSPTESAVMGKTFKVGKRYDFFVRNMQEAQPDTPWIPVKGTVVAIIPGGTFFVHRKIVNSEVSKAGAWSVSEASTGLAMGAPQPTRKEAIEAVKKSCLMYEEDGTKTIRQLIQQNLASPDDLSPLFKKDVPTPAAPAPSTPEKPAEPVKAKYETGKTYPFHVKRGTIGEPEWVEVKGTVVDLAPGLIAFVHRPVGNQGQVLKSGWRVSEATTGTAIKSLNSPSKEAAVDEAADEVEHMAQSGQSLQKLVQETLAHGVTALSPTFKMEADKSEDASKLTETIKAVADKKKKMPKLVSPDAKTLTEQEQKLSAGRKDYDADLSMVSGKKGTNEGGLYKDKQLQTMHYIKWPSEEAARVEVLAGRLYQLAGVPVPDLSLIKFGGKWAVKSDWLSTATPITAAQMKEKPGIRENFAVDAWLANWDVVGTAHDNIVMVSEGTAWVPYRVDLGGSLIFRAQGKTKPFNAGKVAELETMSDPAKASVAATVFSGLTLAEKKAGAAKIAAISDQQINEAVDSCIPDSMEVEGTKVNTQLRNALKKRRNYIIENVLNYEPPKPLTLAQLKQATTLKPSSIELVQQHAKDGLTVPGNTATKTHVQETVLKDQLGKAHGEAALTSIQKVYTGWKGSSCSDSGMLLRWASAKHKGQEQNLWPKLQAYWAHSGGGTVAENKLKAAIEQHGAATVNGVAVNNEMHTALFGTQFAKATKKATTPGKTVTLYRGWRSDLVQKFGWGAAQVGDEIEVTDPMLFSFSASRAKANTFYHQGGRLVKVTMPVECCMASDRLTNMGGGYVQEDEVLFLCPKGYRMEVLK